MRLHELHFTLILLLKLIVLLLGPGVGHAAREAHCCVVVYGVHGVWQDLLKTGEVHRVRISVEEQDVVRVNLADGLFYPGIKDLELVLLAVRWLVHWVVPSHLVAPRLDTAAM